MTQQLSDKIDLRAWSDFLDFEIKILDAWIYGTTGKCWSKNRENLRVLENTDDPAFQRAVEAAIEVKAQTGEWSKSLAADVYRHLFYRAFNASGMLIAICGAQDGAPHLLHRGNPLSPPSPADKPAFIRWLFRDLWDACSADFIKGVLDSEVIPFPPHGRLG